MSKLDHLKLIVARDAEVDSVAAAAAAGVGGDEGNSAAMAKSTSSSTKDTAMWQSAAARQVMMKSSAVATAPNGQRCHRAPLPLPRGSSLVRLPPNCGRLSDDGNRLWMLLF